MGKSYYELMGVGKNFKPEELKANWRLIARELHPDKGGNAAEFAEASAAYATLSDSDARRKYEAQLAIGTTECPTCSGRGTVYKQRGLTSRTEAICTGCKGSGRVGVLPKRGRKV